MELLINNPSTFGKLNCTLVFSLDKEHFTAVFGRIIEIFEPENKVFSSFDLQNFEMIDFDISKPFENDQSIRKVIFVKGNNKIILEYYDGKYTIEHLIGDNSQSYDGREVIEKFACKYKDATLISGYELSIDIDEYPQSLTTIINDDSLHPLIVCPNTEKGFEMIVYDSISDSLSKEKKERIGKYIERLNLPMV